jgi:hypothetical protein
MFFFETFSGESAVRVSFVVCRCSVGQEFGFPDSMCISQLGQASRKGKGGERVQIR